MSIAAIKTFDLRKTLSYHTLMMVSLVLLLRGGEVEPATRDSVLYKITLGAHT